MKKLIKIIGICGIAGVVALMSLMAAVTICAGREYPVVKSDCAIVLGARVWEDGTLSKTLRARVDAALDAYQAGTMGVIIVCGGQGSNEPTSEERAMCDYLTSNGVPQGDIYLDETSVNTLQNLQNAKAIMQEQGWTTAAITTSDYHLTRAMWLAKDLGIHACGIKAGNPIQWSTKMINYARESLSWILYGVRKIL